MSHLEARLARLSAIDEPENVRIVAAVRARLHREQVVGRGDSVPVARARRGRGVRIGVLVGALFAVSAGLAAAAGVLSLPSSLEAGSGLEPAVPGSSASIANDVGADGAVTLVASDEDYRLVKVASTTAFGGYCWAVQRAADPASYSEVECPKTHQAVDEPLHDMTVWHQLGVVSWASPILGFVRDGVDHIIVTTSEGTTYQLSVVNGVYAYDGRLDDVVSIAAAAADGTIMQTVRAVQIPLPTQTAATP